MDRTSYFAHVSTMLDIFIRLARYILVLAVVGSAISSIPRSKKYLEMDYCTSTFFEYRMMILFRTLSFGFSMLSVLMMIYVKLRLSLRFIEVAAGRMTLRTVVTSSISMIIFSAHAMFIAGFASAALTVFYAIQARSRKLRCMGAGARFALVGSMGVVVVLLLRASFRMFRRVFT